MVLLNGLTLHLPLADDYIIDTPPRFAGFQAT
jgi:hypothetical protein